MKKSNPEKLAAKKSHAMSEQLQQMNTLTPQEYHKLVREYNQTYQEYPQDQTVYEWFEERVKKTPNNIAVVFEEQQLTYKELNERSNQLARYLRKQYQQLTQQDFKPDTLIALYLDRSLEMIVAILAISKAGGAYVPLATNFPAERIKYILEDTKTNLVITQQQVQSQLPVVAKQPIHLVVIDDKKLATQLNQLPTSNLKKISHVKDLVYVIYTSGTTGRPKGVMIEHRALYSFIRGFIDKLPLNEINVLSTTSYVFDIFGLEYLLPLCTSGTLYLASIETFVSELIKHHPKINLVQHPPLDNQHDINLLQQTPSVWRQVLSNLSPAYTAGIIALTGGEALDFNVKQSLHQHFTTVLNVYGPTETAIYSTIYPSNADDILSSTIGKPLANEQVYLLDANLMPVPQGEIGELYIGGAGLARGYLNLPALTAEKFIFNPFATKEDQTKGYTRLYKTGDLARWLPDGNIEYLGRNDFQVKIRGYRIELGEIENALSRYAGVKQSVVLVKEHQGEGDVPENKYLVGYYVADNQLNNAQIIKYLQGKLPEYMVPNILVYLPKFPLTINGKLDRKALPVPIFEQHNKYVAPSNQQEQLICAAFAQTLGIKKIGVNDDFFNLGGSSIQAIQLTTILQANFAIKIADIFTQRTPAQLAKNSSFGKDVLQQKLAQIKLLYKNKRMQKHVVNKLLQKKIDRYVKNSDQLQIDGSVSKPITNVLLTGATGFLGSNLLNQLLTQTNYHIFLLVRAKSQQEALERVNKKFQFYFDRTLVETPYRASVQNSRIFVINADIEKKYLGLQEKEYQTLVAKIDSIIHAAASVKYYGDYDRFYSINVQATINLLELAKLTKTKDFHYISTYSVLNFGMIPNCAEYAYTEDDLPDSLEPWDNVYVKTKREGEQAVIKYRNEGVSSNIYRIGNLVFNTENFRTQENIEDNAFFNWLKCLFTMKCIAPEISLVEISQVNVTAQAIVKLFDKKLLVNHIFHVFNPQLFDLSKVIMRGKTAALKTLTLEKFIDHIAYNLEHNIDRNLIINFLLQQGWLEGVDVNNLTTITVLQTRTLHILQQLGFKWQGVTNEEFITYLAGKL